MAYSIRFPQNVNSDRVAKLVSKLEKFVSNDGRFFYTAEEPNLSYKGLPKNSSVGRLVVALRRIRLKQKKPYCGNHPGPCEINLFVARKKPNSSYLEWDDWVEFNNMINDFLDLHCKDAEVWSVPQDANGTFWIRKEGKRRIKYEWWTEYGPYNSVRVWNKGTPDQFVE